MIQNVKVTPNGGMQKDLDELYVGGGDYIDALNITHISESGQTTQSVTPILGNEEVFRLGNVTVQNAKYRIFVGEGESYEDSYDNTNFIIFSNGNPFFIFHPTTAYPDWAGIASEIQSEFNSVYGAGIILVTTNGSTYIDIEILNNSESYTFATGKILDFRPNSLSFVLYKEAIVSSLTGPLKVIGSFDLNGDLFIWSAVRETEFPDINIQSVTYVGGILTIVAPNHGLSATQLIYVNIIFTTSNIRKLTSVVSVVSASTIIIYTTTPSGTFVSGELFAVRSAVGEIGVAQQDKNTLDWTYTRLLRSKVLNFNTLHQQDTHCEINNGNPVLYFTDDYNKPRVLYYYGDYVTDGFLTFYNPDGIYDYLNLNTESLLQIPEQNLRVDTTQYDGGGSLKNYTRQYAVRLLTEDAEASPFTFLTNSLPTGKGLTTDLFTTYNADAIGVNTGKRNVITVSGIDFNQFFYLELAVVEYAGYAISGYIVKRIILNGENGDVVEITHDGTEVGTIQLDLNELNRIISPIATAKNIVALSNRLTLSNITLDIQYDLREWARTIQYNLKTLWSKYVGDYSNIKNAGEYQVSNYVLDKMGYMHNETYRFGIQLYIKGVGYTQAYFIDDVKFTINIENPLQQLSALADYDLQRINAGIEEFATNYIEFTNVDLNYALEDGKFLSDICGGFRFVRLDCISEVLFTGTCFPGSGDMNSSIFTSPPTPYAAAPTAVSRRFGGIISPDIRFNIVAPEFSSGDILKVMGNADIVNDSSTYRAIEVNGNFNTANDYLDVPLEDSVIINGYLDGAPTSAVLGGSAFSNTFDDGGVNAHKVIAVKTTTGNYIINNGGNTDYGFYHVQYFREKLNKYDELVNQNYKCFSQSIIDLTDHSLTSEYEIFGGDTFTQKTYHLIHFIIGVPSGTDRYWLGFYSQNRMNSQMRYGVLFQPFAISVATVNQEDQLYDNAYTPYKPIQTIVGFDINANNQVDLPTRIYYSNKKINGSKSDAYRVFAPLNFRDLYQSDGEVIHMANGNGELLTWQQKRFERQYFNNSGTLQTTGASELLVGDGTVLGRQGQFISQFGTTHKWSVIKGISKGGNDTFYWINSDYKKVCRFGYDGTVTLSDIDGMKSFFADYLQFAQLYDTPANNYGIHGVWHDRLGEAIWTVRAVKSVSEFNLDTVYSIGDEVTQSDGIYYMGFEQLPQIYISLVNNNYGANVPDQTIGTFWELATNTYKHYNLFTISYNEIKNKFTTFYSHKPKIYLKYQNSYLSQIPIELSDGEFPIYEHNRGDYSAWYCEELKIGKTPYTITVTEGSRTVTNTGLDFLILFPFPDTNYYAFIFEGVKYKIESVQSSASLTLEEESPITTILTEGTYVKCCSENPYLEGVTNPAPNDEKHFTANQFNTDLNPIKVISKTKEHETYSDRIDLEYREEFSFGEIRNDIKTSTTGKIATGDTSNLFGKYLKTKIFFKSFEYNKLFNFITKFRLSSRTSNK